MAATEADDGAAITMQVLKLLSGGEPAGFNDLRYWDSRDGLYWFVNSGALAPVLRVRPPQLAQGLLVRAADAMYFREGRRNLLGRLPDSRRCHVGAFFVPEQPAVPLRGPGRHRCSHARAVAGTHRTLQPRLAAMVHPDVRPHREKINTNHPMTVFGDYLAELKALAGELDIPFECYDHRTP